MDKADTLAGCDMEINTEQEDVKDMINEVLNELKKIEQDKKKYQEWQKSKQQFILLQAPFGMSLPVSNNKILAITAGTAFTWIMGGPVGGLGALGTSVIFVAIEDP